MILMSGPVPIRFPTFIIKADPAFLFSIRLIFFCDLPL